MKRQFPNYEDDIETTAARWVARRDAGLSRAQQTEFEHWKASDPRHAVAFVEFESMWREMGRPRRTGVAAAVKRECITRQRRRYWRRASASTVAIAAIVLFGVVLPRWSPPAEISPVL